MHTLQVEPRSADVAFADRRRIADRIFRGALIFTLVLTLFWAFVYATGRHPFFFEHYEITAAGVGRVLGSLLFFYVIWGFVWWGIKNLLLKYFVGFTKEERRQAFSSRMHTPYDVADLVSRYSERTSRPSSWPRTCSTRCSAAGCSWRCSTRTGSWRPHITARSRG
jgi:hypothetical protein